LGADTRHVGIGTRLKASQVSKVSKTSPDIDYVTWTFDPFLRNREFNLGMGAFIGGGEHAWEVAPYEGGIPGTVEDRFLAVLPIRSERVKKYMARSIMGSRVKVPYDWVLSGGTPTSDSNKLTIANITKTSWVESADSKRYLELNDYELGVTENIISIELPLTWLEMFPDITIPPAQKWLESSAKMFIDYFKREYIVTHYSRSNDHHRSFVILQRISLRDLLNATDPISKRLL